MRRSDVDDPRALQPGKVNMKPKIKGALIVSLSENGRHCWMVAYEFCGVTAPMTVYAKSELDARTEATNHLRYLDN
jgi:hypothetical protein